MHAYDRARNFRSPAVYGYIVAFRALKPDCQLLLFSATYDVQVMNFATTVVPEAVIIRLRKEEESLDNIKQYYVVCDSSESKYEALANLYAALTIGQTMVFCQVSFGFLYLFELMFQNML